mmetsp:Transcript_14024/g.42227  ORF Transcript_14024/g.42227 Transcript_14024/m.42227 type:complete len:432 (+) Transcript_14024:746-2041(+)
MQVQLVADGQRSGLVSGDALQHAVRERAQQELLVHDGRVQRVEGVDQRREEPAAPGGRQRRARRGAAQEAEQTEHEAVVVGDGEAAAGKADVAHLLVGEEARDRVRTQHHLAAADQQRRKMRAVRLAVLAQRAEVLAAVAVGVHTEGGLLGQGARATVPLQQEGPGVRRRRAQQQIRPRGTHRLQRGLFGGGARGARRGRRRGRGRGGGGGGGPGGATTLSRRQTSTGGRVRAAARSRHPLAAFATATAASAAAGAGETAARVAELRGVAHRELGAVAQQLQCTGEQLFAEERAGVCTILHAGLPRKVVQLVTEKAFDGALHVGGQHEQCGGRQTYLPSVLAAHEGVCGQRLKHRTQRVGSCPGQIACERSASGERQRRRGARVGSHGTLLRAGSTRLRRKRRVITGHCQSGRVVLELRDNNGIGSQRRRT